MARRLAFLLAAWTLSAGARAAAPVGTFTLTDLGTLGGRSIARGINEREQVVGESSLPGGNEDEGAPSHAFLWQDGAMTDLGTLGGDFSGASDINDHGWIAGGSTLAPSSFERHAVVWVDGGIQDLGTLPGGTSSYAHAINNQGQVVGFSEYGDPDEPELFHPTLWQHRQAVDLGTLGGRYGEASAINEHGDVVGYTELPNGDLHAALWSNGRVIDLGDLGGGFSTANGINDRGQIVGTARDPDFGIHAVGWENGSIRDLGTMSVYPSARAFAVNDRGQVVGDGDVLPLGNHLFFWDKGTTFDIPQSGGPIGSLFAVNDSGAAVGYTTLDENFTTRAILVKRVRP